MDKLNKADVTALLAAISITSGAAVTVCQPVFGKSIGTDNPMFLAEKKAGTKTGKKKSCGGCDKGTCHTCATLKGKKGVKGKTAPAKDAGTTSTDKSGKDDKSSAK